MLTSPTAIATGGNASTVPMNSRISSTNLRSVYTIRMVMKNTTPRMVVLDTEKAVWRYAATRIATQSAISEVQRTFGSGREQRSIASTAMTTWYSWRYDL